ncbi:MAG: hypothetical protein ABFS56_13500 [Pseudomonadota bacterium]
MSFLSNGLIADWIHWQNSPEKEPFETFRRVLKRLSPPELETGDIGILEPGKPTRISSLKYRHFLVFRVLMLFAEEPEKTIK